MYHVHTSTLSSSTTTTEPVSTLSPSVLFPFFQPNSSSPASSSSLPPSSASPLSAPCAPSAPHHTTTTSSSSSCPCHNPHILPAPASAPPTFISLPSANPHQSVILPLPQPSPPPTTGAAATSSSSSSASPSSCLSSAAASATDPTATSGSLPGKSPLLVFSHGSTQVDTFVPSTQCLQRTLYSWSQMSDYTTKYCWNLPATSSSSTQSSQAAGQPVGHNVSINNSNGRICQGDDVVRCTGHPWVNFSYHMQVKQWQERKEDEAAAALAAAAAAAATHHQRQHNPAHHNHHIHDMGVKGLEVRVAPATDLLVEGIRRHRHQQPHYSDADSDAGSMFDDVDDGDDADEEDDNWNDLCSTTDDDDEDEYELTDVDM